MKLCKRCKPWSTCFNVEISRKFFSSQTVALNFATDSLKGFSNQHKRTRTTKARKKANNQTKDYENMKNDAHSKETRQIFYRISNASSANNIVNILDDPSNVPHIDICVLTEAMMRCEKLNAFNQGLEIAKNIFHGKYNHINRDIPFYGTFFLFCANADRIRFAYPKYYQHMINVDKIEPNIIIVNILLRGLSQRSKNWKDNDIIINEIFENIICKYNLEMTHFTYNAIISIYGNCSKPEKAEKWFLKMCKDENMQEHINDVSFGGIIKAFSQVGNIEKMLYYKNMAETKYPNIKWKNINYSPLIGGYLRIQDPKCALKMYNEMIEKNGNKNLTQIEFSQLQTICLQLLTQESQKNGNNTHSKIESKIEKYYRLVCEILPNQMENEYNIKLNPQNVNLMYQALLIYYPQNEWDIALQTCEIWIKDKYKFFGHWGIDVASTGDRMRCIDLHHMSREHAIFRLRYIFYKEKELLYKCIDDYGEIVVIVGRGAHSIKSFKGTNKTLSQLICHELKSWQPPIHAKVDDKRPGCLVITKNDFETFFNCHSDELGKEFLCQVTDALDVVC